MSFILDALKKSEEERRRGEMPDLRTEHAAAPPPRPRHLFWPTLFAVALLVNVLLLLWWSPWQAPAPVAAPEAPAPLPGAATVAAEPSPPSTEPAVSVVAVAGSPPRAAAEPAGWSDLRREPVPPAPQRAAASVSPRAEAAVIPRLSPSLPHLRNLPDSIRQALPDLTISLHYYDPDPRSRIVRLNGRILREGATVIEGLVVEEITSTGVVLSWRGERFRAGDF